MMPARQGPSAITWLFAAAGAILAAILAAQNAAMLSETRSIPTVGEAELLAPNYVVVHRVRDLKRKDQAVCVGTPDIIELPSGRLIASMELWLKGATFGLEGGIDYPNHCLIKASDDGGKSWRQISTNGITWGSLFYLNDALYMIGNDPHERDIRIVRSNDGGETWSKPAVLFNDGSYHGSATSVVVHNGFIYRAFEDSNNDYASLVVAGDVSKDLLNADSWRMSPRASLPLKTPELYPADNRHQQGPDAEPNYFIEGNVTKIGDELYVLMRSRIHYQRTAGMMAVCKLTDDGEKMKYAFHMLYPMPGGQNKFKILFDEPSGLYWTCASPVPTSLNDDAPYHEQGVFGNPGESRRILMLMYSLDGFNWFQAGCVAMSKNPLEAFHCSSQIAVGDDLLIVSRSSFANARYTWETEAKTGPKKVAYNNHDTNAITFHRVRNFRSLALDLKPDFDFSAGPKHVHIQ